MYQTTIRVVATLATVGALVASAAGCGLLDSEAEPAGGDPTATPALTVPAEEPDQVSFDFPAIRSLIENSGQAEFTADYHATAPSGAGAIDVTLARQAPVTGLLMDQTRLVWTPDDFYVCQGAGDGQCFRNGAPSEHEDPRGGPDRDWGAMLLEVGFQVLSPIGAWENLETLGRDGAEVQEYEEDIAGRPSSCVRLFNEAPQLDWTGTVVACFLANGVVSRYVIELTNSAGSTQVTVELTGYQDTPDPAVVEVPTDAPLRG